MCETFESLFVNGQCFNLDILLSAHLIPNQEDLFNTASIFVYENKGKLTKTMEWKEMMETNPKLIANVLSNVLGLQ